MIRLINRVTGSDMWVADNRVAEYLARGHKLAPAPDPDKPEKATPEEMKTVRKRRK